MARPKELFWVDFKKNGAKARGRRHWAAQKGGKFSTLDAAKGRAAELKAEWPGAIVTVYTTGPLQWREVVVRTLGYPGEVSETNRKERE